MEYHHPFCNGSRSAPVDTCKWCGGENGFWARFGEKPMDEIMKEYFPDAIEIKRD